MPIVGYGGRTVNVLRLFSARASDQFDIGIFNSGDYIRAVHEKITGESISKVLYPSDTIAAGKELRLMQEYFLVACSVQRHLQALPRDSTSRYSELRAQGRHPDERHASRADRRGADAHLRRRGADAVGRGVGASPSRRAATRTTRCCPRRWRSGRSS